MRRWIGALAFAAALSGLAGGAAAQDKMRIAAPSVALGNAPIYVAEQLGYFKQVGVQPEITIAPSGPAAIAAAMNGDIDAVLGSATTIMSARKADGDIVMFTALATQYGVNVVVTRKWADSHNLSTTSSYREKIAALKGATIAITTPGGSNDQLIRFLADEAGLNPDRDMTLVTMGDTSAMLAAFGQNRVDGLAVSSPTSPAAAHDFNGLMLFNLQIGEIESLNGYFGAAIAANSAWLKKNGPGIGVKFARAVQMGFDAMHDPARTSQARDLVYAAYFKTMNAELFALLWRDAVRGSPKGPDITRKMVQGVVDFSNRYSKDKIDPGLIDTAFTNEIVESAHKEMGR